MATTDTNVSQVVVNKLTKAQYTAATKSPTEFYVVTDDTKFQVVAAGTIDVGNVSAGTNKTGSVNIPTQPDTNYVVLFSHSQETSSYDHCIPTSRNKTVSSFGWYVWNNASSQSGSVKLDYVVIKY